MLKTILLCTVFILLAFSCSRPPYHATNKVYKKQAKIFAATIKSNPENISVDIRSPAYWVGTTNFNLRKPNFVIIHHTAQNSCDQTIKTFTLPRTQVSAHYVICKNGTIHHMLNDYLRAWHGGVAKWGSLNDINSASIGIELDNNGFETFSTPQLQSLLVLLDTLKSRYNIPANNFIGHADIAPTRKNDPNINFPWQTLAQKGFGSWYGDTTNLTLPDNFNTIQALRIVGYDTKDSLAAIQAFKRHFLADSTLGLQESGKRVLYNIMLKAM